MKQINWFEKLIGSGFYTGYIPFASGTFGSIAAIIIYLIPGFEKPEIIIPAIIIFLVYGLFVSSKFEDVYGKDPAECTVDEVVGTWIALIALPKTMLIILTSFLIWRALDIVKPFPARTSEKLPKGFGIMADDVISGFYSLIILHIIVYTFGVY
ncbi:MAG TPA: phosphatidylglycerophosphatase A [Ignavibacteriales bacterium]|nr:phosphatidylglycerophosphatase A [Ignavibacteriales bacterium]